MTRHKRVTTITLRFQKKTNQWITVRSPSTIGACFPLTIPPPLEQLTIVDWPSSGLNYFEIIATEAGKQFFQWNYILID